MNTCKCGCGLATRKVYSVGHGRRGRKFSPHTLETKKKISDAARRRSLIPMTEEQKKRISDTLKMYYQNRPEVRSLISLRRLGSKMTQETCLKHSNHAKQYLLRHPDWMQRMTERNRQLTGGKMPIEVREKISLSKKNFHKTHKRTSESRKKQSISLRKYYSGHPEAREAARQAIIKNIHLAGKRGIAPNKQTKIEMILEEVVKKLNFPYVTQYIVDRYPIDIAIPKYKIAIYADGCYWHSCPLHFPDAFPKKREGDSRVNKFLRKEGWYVIRLWEHDIRNKESISRLLTSFLNLKQHSNIITLGVFDGEKMPLKGDL